MNGKPLLGPMLAQLFFFGPASAGAFTERTLEIHLVPSEIVANMMLISNGNIFDNGDCTDCPEWPTPEFIWDIKDQLAEELDRHRIDIKVEGDYDLDGSPLSGAMPNLLDHQPVWDTIQKQLEGAGNTALEDAFNVPPGPSPASSRSRFAHRIIVAAGTLASKCGPVSYKYEQRVGLGDHSGNWDSFHLNTGEQLNPDTYPTPEVAYIATGGYPMHTTATLEISGDCGCEDIGGVQVGEFRIGYERTFYLQVRRESLREKVGAAGTYWEEDLIAVPVEVQGRCGGNVDCRCPEERDALLENTQTDGVIEGGLVGAGDRIDVAVSPIPLQQAVLRAGDARCESGGLPCDANSVALAQESLHGIAGLLPEKILASGSGKFKAAIAISGDELRALTLAYLKADMPELENGGQGYRFNGTAAISCGSVAYDVLVSVINGYGGEELLVSVRLKGECTCQGGDGDVQQFSATYSVALDPYPSASNWTEVQIDFRTGERDCAVSSKCCDALPGDALPGSDTYVLNWDSPLWCTYGGGTILLLPPGPRAPVTTPASPLPLPPEPGAPASGGGMPPLPPTGMPTPPTDVPSPLPPAPGVSSGDQPSGDGTPVPAGLTPVPPADSGDTETPAPPPVPESPETDQPPPAPPVELQFKATTAVLERGTYIQGAGALMLQVNTGEPAEVAGDPGAERNDAGAGDGELSTTTDADGNGTLTVPADVAAAIGRSLIEVEFHASRGTLLTYSGSVDPATVLPSALLAYAQPALTLAGSTIIPLLIPDSLGDSLQGAIDSAGATSVAPNVCIDPKPLAEPFFSSKGSWRQPYPDQWAIQRVGFTGADGSAWNQVSEQAEPVTIAVIDSGLDWNHREIDWSSLWRNSGEIPDNGIDDEGNGYVDDTIGWDFWDNDRKPWDFDGHGTFVAGVMFANPDNGEGIVGVSRSARLMVLKVMNAFGHTRASSVAKAIKYAADNGARVINLSLGGPESSPVVRMAIDYAYERNVVVVVAAGNEAVPAENQTVAGVPNALTVAATGFDDKRSIYSNFGLGIDLAAPGDDILSLRARRTDLLRNIPGVDYQAESAFVGEDRRYYRASGTSFAAPIVSGVAGLVIASNPDLSADEVMRMVKQSARDVETPGVDHFTGYGVVDAVAALQARPEYYIDAVITGVGVVERSGVQMLTISGSADADEFEEASVSIGKGVDPAAWETVGKLKDPADATEIATIPSTRFAGSRVWIIRLQVEHRDGSTREFRFRLDLG